MVDLCVPEKTVQDANQSHKDLCSGGTSFDGTVDLIGPSIGAHRAEANNEVVGPVVEVRNHQSAPFGPNQEKPRNLTPPSETTTSIAPPRFDPAPGARLVMNGEPFLKTADSMKSASMTLRAGIPCLAANPGVSGCSRAQNCASPAALWLVLPMRQSVAPASTSARAASAASEVTCDATPLG